MDSYSRYCIVISLLLTCLLMVDAVDDCPSECCKYPTFRPCTDTRDNLTLSCHKQYLHRNECKVGIIYAVQSQPIVFTAQPEGGMYPLASNIILTCNTTSLQCYAEGNCPSIYWTLNGSLVEDHSGWFSVNDYSLTIKDFGETKQGRYVCHVNDSSFSLQSHAAEVLLPKFTGWSYDVYDTYPNETQDIIKHYVPPGGDMILECDTIGHSKYTITKWNPATIDSDDIVLPNGNLLIRNFTDSNCVSYFCILSVSNIDSKSRQYSLCQEADGQLEPSLIASPKSQTISYGSNVTLYCLAISNTTISYTWFKNGAPLEITRPSMPQVLILENVTESSTINCLAFNEFGNDTATARITVLGKPIVSLRVINHSIPITLNDKKDVLITSTTGNITILCIVDQSEQDIKYTWYYRGNLNKEESNQLIVVGSKVDKLIGSVQCLVSSNGGTATGYMRILIKDKPNTPENLHYISPSYLVYQIQWNHTINYFRDIKYKLQIVYTDNFLEAIHVNTTETCLIYDAKCLAYNIHSKQSVRLCAYRTSTDTSSDCVELKNNLKDTPLTLPNPLHLTGMYSTVPEGNNSVLSVDFKYDNLSTSYDKYNYYDDCRLNTWYNFGYCCSNNCCDDITNDNDDDEGINASGEHSIDFACHQKCYWKVGITRFTDGEISWTKCLNFTVPDLVPSKPGQLIKATWKDNSGIHVDVEMMLPNSNISCGPLWVIIQYDSFEIPYSLSSVSDTSQPFQHVFSMILDSCWKPHNISFYYNNSIGQSDDSNIITLHKPSKDIIEGFGNMKYDKLNQSFINISWTLKDGMECLISVRQYIWGITFYLKPTDTGKCQPNETDYQSEGTQLQELNKTNLELNLGNTHNNHTSYCVKVKFNLKDEDNVNKYQLMTINNDYTTSSTTAVPTHSTNPTSVASNTYISTALFLEVLVPGAVFLIFLVIIFVTLVILIPKCCKRKKNDIINHELQCLIRTPDGSDEEIMKPKITIDETKSTISEETRYEKLTGDKQYLMDKYLSDVEENCLEDIEDTQSIALETLEAARLNGSPVEIFNSSKGMELQVVAEVHDSIEYDCDDQGKKISTARLHKRSTSPDIKLLQPDVKNLQIVEMMTAQAQTHTTVQSLIPKPNTKHDKFNDTGYLDKEMGLDKNDVTITTPSYHDNNPPTSLGLDLTSRGSQSHVSPVSSNTTPLCVDQLQNLNDYLLPSPKSSQNRVSRFQLSPTPSSQNPVSRNMSGFQLSQIPLNETTSQMSLESVSSSDSVFDDEFHNTSQASISTHNTRNGSNCTSGFHSYPNTPLSTDSSCIPNSPTQFKFPPLNHKHLSRPHSSTEQFPKHSRRQSQPNVPLIQETHTSCVQPQTFWSNNCHLQNPSLSQEITFSKRLDSNEYPSGGLWKLPAPVKQGPNQPIRLQQSRRSSEGHVAKIQPIRSHVGNQPFEYHQQTEMMNLGRHTNHLSFPTSPVNNLSLQNISSNRPSLGSSLGPSLGSGLGPSLEPRLGSGLGPSLEPRLGSGLGPSFGSSLGPSLGSGLGPSLELRLGSGLGPSLGSGLGPSLGPSLGSGLGPRSRHSAEPGLGPSLVSFMYESKTQPHHSTDMKSRKIGLTTSTPEKWTASRTSCDKIMSPSDRLLRCDLTQYRYPFQSETLPNIMHNKSHDKGKKSHDKGNNRTEHSRNPGQTDVIFESKRGPVIPSLLPYFKNQTGQTRFTEPHTHTSSQSNTYKDPRTNVPHTHTTSNGSNSYISNDSHTHTSSDSYIPNDLHTSVPHTHTGSNSYIPNDPHTSVPHTHTGTNSYIHNDPHTSVSRTHTTSNRSDSYIPNDPRTHTTSNGSDSYIPNNPHTNVPHTHTTSNGSDSYIPNNPHTNVPHTHTTSNGSDSYIPNNPHTNVPHTHTTSNGSDSYIPNDLHTNVPHTHTTSNPSNSYITNDPHINTSRLVQSSLPVDISSETSSRTNSISESYSLASTTASIEEMCDNPEDLFDEMHENLEYFSSIPSLHSNSYV